MAYFTFEDKQIYYETHGSGKPLLVLNGIMMSCFSWANFIAPFSKDNQLILVDFLDQGRSQKMTEEYTQDIQVEVTNALLNHLSIDKTNIMGISYGGEVAQLFAVKYADRVEKLILFNTTAKTGAWLGDIGDGWNLSANDAENYYLTTIPVIYSPEFYKKNIEWMNNRRQLLKQVFSNKEFMDSMTRLTNSSRDYDVIDSLKDITAPTLVVSAQQDFLTPIEDQKVIVDNIPNSHHMIIPNCGHASMYEQPMLFTTLTLGFVSNDTLDFGII